jgi:hypothetical protein
VCRIGGSRACHDMRPLQLAQDHVLCMHGARSIACAVARYGVRTMQTQFIFTSNPRTRWNATLSALQLCTSLHRVHIQLAAFA